MTIRSSTEVSSSYTPQPVAESHNDAQVESPTTGNEVATTTEPPEQLFAKSAYEPPRPELVKLDAPAPEESSEEVPRENLQRGDSGPEVEKLQQSLVKLGYMSQEQMKTGAGIFGPQTEAALKRFQKEHGVPDTGNYGPLTRGALSKATRVPATPVTSSGGQGISAEEAFITQFRSEYNPTGPTGSTNCGPTSLAMSLAYSGRMPPGLSKEQQVDYARALMSPARKSEFTYAQASDGTRVPQLNRDKELTGGTMVADGVRAAGLTPRYNQGWEALDRELAAGNPVIANGYTNETWRKQFPERMGSGDVGHLNAILGKTDDGRYIVADPLHTGGPVAMTREQLGRFFSPTQGMPSFTALQGAGRPAGTPTPNTGGSLPTLNAGTASVPTTGTTQANGDVKAKATQDARLIEQAAAKGLPDGARQLETLLQGNPDPAYRDALIDAARPTLEKMGAAFSAFGPRVDRMLNPPPPQKPRAVADVNQTELFRAQADDNRDKQNAFLGLMRSAELLSDRGSAVLGDALARQMKENVSKGPVTEAIKQSIESGMGSKLAFDLARGLNKPDQPGRTTRGWDAKAVSDTAWSSINKLRTELSAAADKLDGHHEQMASLLAGPAQFLDDKQQTAAVEAFQRNCQYENDQKAFYDAGDKLARALPGIRAAQAAGQLDHTQGRQDVAALTQQLDRLAKTPTGATFLAEDIQRRGRGEPSFLQKALEPWPGRKDLKEAQEKTAQAIAQTVGLWGLSQVAANDKTGAMKTFDEGLKKFGPTVFGLSEEKMDEYLKLVSDFDPNKPGREAERLRKVFGEKIEPGTPFAPDTVTGQALRGLGMVVNTMALAEKIQNKTDVANRVSALGDFLGLGADGAALGLETFTTLSNWAKAAQHARTASVFTGAQAFFKSADAAGKFFGPLGGLIGAVGDGMSAVNNLQNGKSWQAAGDASKALGSAIMGAAALFSAGPGTQLIGAALFVGGIGLNYVGEWRDREALQQQQVNLLTRSGLDRGVAEAIVSEPELLKAQLLDRAKLSIPQMQELIRDYPSVVQDSGDLTLMVDAAVYQRLQGANVKPFLDRMAMEHGGAAGRPASSVDTAQREAWMRSAMIQYAGFQAGAEQNRMGSSPDPKAPYRSSDELYAEHMDSMFAGYYPHTMAWRKQLPG
jgi:peptidoglycan hydrolase-like protein with peptidoglycan-binding domain